MNDTLFENLGKHPRRARKFASRVSAFSNGPGFNVDHLANNPFWTRVGEATVIDLSTSTGEAMIAITTKIPRLTIIVQDLPSLVAEHLMPLPKLQGRSRPLAHDFCDKQFIKEAGVVLHNWSEQDCCRILRALVPALKPRARIVGNE